VCDAMNEMQLDNELSSLIDVREQRRNTSTKKSAEADEKFKDNPKAAGRFSEKLETISCILLLACGKPYTSHLSSADDVAHKEARCSRMFNHANQN